MADQPSDRPYAGDPNHELQRSSAVFTTEAEQLLDMERRKRDLDPSDPARIPRAREIET